jgi:hypothetical protein
LALTLVTVLVLIVAGCGADDDASPGDTASDEPTTSSTELIAPTLPEVPTPDGSDDETTTPVSVDLDAPSGDQECLYRKQLLVTAGRHEITVGGQLLTEITVPADDLPVGADPELLNARGLYLYDTGTLDPLDVAFSLQSQGVVASPVLLVVPSGHFILAPGQPAATTPFVLPPPPDADPEGAVVAVVDTGYDDRVGNWLGSSVTPASSSAQDTEQASGTEFEGHAMFIASIIRQYNPDAHVVIAGMPNALAKGDPTTEFERLFASHGIDSVPDLTNPVYVADELDLLAAVDRLLRTENTYSVLNLSGGTYQCSGLSHSALVTWTALKYWYDTAGPVPVVAAAGNHGPGGPPANPVTFVPGGYGSGVVSLDGQDVPLYGVESVAGNGVLSSFSNKGAFKEVGEGLCGISVDPTSGTVWSGSSFATAVASAKFTRQGASGNDLTPRAAAARTPADDLPAEMRSRLMTCNDQQG